MTCNMCNDTRKVWAGDMGGGDWVACPKCKTTIDFYTLRGANANRQQEWDAQNTITDSYRGNELAGEVGEMLEQAVRLLELSIAVGRVNNTIKKIEREKNNLKGSRITIEELIKELGDVCVCVDLVAMHYDIDLVQATKDKFNSTSIKHGFKTRYI